MVVVIDFGIIYSGYVFSFICDLFYVYMMRKWEGGDLGVVSEKILISIFLIFDG